jgi:CheY-like chemotaxis protein
VVKAGVRKPVVAVVNSNDDLVSALQHALETDGFNIVTAHVQGIQDGTLDFAVFLEEHDPAVVIYDIALPYDSNWKFLSMIRQLPQAQRPFVVTTVNKRALDARVGPTDTIEIQGGHTDDVEPTMEAVRKAVHTSREPRSAKRSAGGRKARRNSIPRRRRS